MYEKLHALIIMYEKLHALIAKWEEEWQKLESKIIEEDKKFPGSIGSCTSTQTRRKAVALDFRKRIDQLTELVELE